MVGEESVGAAGNEADVPNSVSSAEIPFATKVESLVGIGEACAAK